VRTIFVETDSEKHGVNLIEHEVNASPPENASPPVQHLIVLR